MKSLLISPFLVGRKLLRCPSRRPSCISATFNLLSPNDKVCVSGRSRPDGRPCYISQARKGGWGQAFGLNEDPSNFSVSCRQVGPITVDLAKLPEREEAFSHKTSIFFKRTRIYRLPDEQRGHNEKGVFADH